MEVWRVRDSYGLGYNGTGRGCVHRTAAISRAKREHFFIAAPPLPQLQTKVSRAASDSSPDHAVEMARDEELVELSFPQYWDERYKAEQHGQDVLESYEWFRNFQKLQPFFDRHLPPPQSGSDCHILHLGCGNSTLTADLYHRGYTNQTSVDFSEVVINAMISKYAQLNTRWLLMDVRELDLPNGSVDIAVDKGTLDAFIHGSLWDPPGDVRTNVGKYVDEVAKVLKPGGFWLYITYRQPHFMKPLLTREKEWTLSVEILEDLDGAGGFDYFGFVMRKRHEEEEKPDSEREVQEAIELDSTTGDTSV